MLLNCGQVEKKFWISYILYGGLRIKIANLLKLNVLSLMLSKISARAPKMAPFVFRV